MCSFINVLLIANYPSKKLHAFTFAPKIHTLSMSTLLHFCKHCVKTWASEGREMVIHCFVFNLFILLFLLWDWTCFYELLVLVLFFHSFCSLFYWLLAFFLLAFNTSSHTVISCLSWGWQDLVVVDPLEGYFRNEVRNNGDLN